MGDDSGTATSVTEGEAHPQLDGAVAFLVRHGESEWNRLGLAQGQAEAPGLTELGRRQAADAAALLRDRGATVVITSDLRRARETAEIMANELGLELFAEPCLRERALGTAEGRPSAELFHGGASGAQGGRVVDPEASPPGGESIRQFTARTQACLERLARKSEGPMVLVTHGGVLRVARMLITLGDDAFAGWGHVPNADVMEVTLPLPGYQPEPAGRPGLT